MEQASKQKKAFWEFNNIDLFVILNYIQRRRRLQRKKGMNRLCFHACVCVFVY